MLAHSGWVVERAAEQTQDFAGSAAQVHQAILPILTDALGPAAATSTVIATLQGLAAASANRSWLSLFEKESRRASSNQFQVGYVRGAGGVPTRATLTSFELDAQQSVTQVLFFRFADTRATLRYATSTLTLNEVVFRQVRDLVEERIRDHFAAFIASIELSAAPAHQKALHRPPFRSTGGHMTVSADSASRYVQTSRSSRPGVNGARAWTAARTSPPAWTPPGTRPPWWGATCSRLSRG